MNAIVASTEARGLEPSERYGNLGFGIGFDADRSGPERARAGFCGTGADSWLMFGIAGYRAPGPFAMAFAKTVRNRRIGVYTTIFWIAGRIGRKAPRLLDPFHLACDNRVEPGLCHARGRDPERFFQGENFASRERSLTVPAEVTPASAPCRYRVGILSVFRRYRVGVSRSFCRLVPGGFRFHAGLGLPGGHGCACGYFVASIGRAS